MEIRVYSDVRHNWMDSNAYSRAVGTQALSLLLPFRGIYPMKSFANFECFHISSSSTSLCCLCILWVEKSPTPDSFPNQVKRANKTRNWLTDNFSMQLWFDHKILVDCLILKTENSKCKQFFQIHSVRGIEQFVLCQIWKQYDGWNIDVSYLFSTPFSHFENWFLSAIHKHIHRSCSNINSNIMFTLENSMNFCLFVVRCLSVYDECFSFFFFLFRLLWNGNRNEKL